MQIVKTIDTWIARVLWVPPQPAHQTAESTSAPGERGVGISLVFSALRCTLQYIILPFLLPVIGLTSNWSLGIVMVLDVVALILVTTSLRQLWKARHPRRWTFLPLAVVAVVLIVAFLWYDIQMLTA